MNLKKEQELAVFTYLTDGKSAPASDPTFGIQLERDEDFHFERTINDMIKEGYLADKIPGSGADLTESFAWEITQKGLAHMKDLAREKYDEKNKIPVYLWAVIIVVALWTFMKLFPRMFHG
jgi:hypothetical protein